MKEYHDKLDSVFKKHVRNKNKAALSAVLFDENGIIYEAYDGYIDKEKKTAPAKDSLYMIGSNTKVLTALGIFRLLEDGKLSLTDDIRNCLPEFSVKSRIGDCPVTVGNLLMHRAGIQCDLYELMIGSGHEYTDVLPALADTYRASVPGEMFSYSNLGYTLLGIICERISGRKYADFLQEVLFEPLGMEVYFKQEKDLPESVSGRTARSYGRSGKRTEDVLGVLLPAGACTYMTIGDLAKIGRLLINKGVFDGKRLYREETIELMQSLDPADPNDSYLLNAGYGLLHNSMVLEHKTGRILGHGGDTLYHHSLFNYLPDEKIGIIIFTNSFSGLLAGRSLQAPLLDAYLEEAGFARKPKEKTVSAADDVTKYIRRYDTAAGPVDIRLSDRGELQATIAKVPVKLHPESGGWLGCTPGTPLLDLTPLRTQIRDVKLKETEYLGKQVLILKQHGIASIIGEEYKRPEMNQVWLRACGTYIPEDPAVRSLVSKMVLSLKDGEPVLTYRMDVSGAAYYLSCISDEEAIIKGFGRNTGQTVYLKQENGDFRLIADGISAIRRQGRSPFKKQR